jgi:hypothetical protein
VNFVVERAAAAGLRRCRARLSRIPFFEEEEMQSSPFIAGDDHLPACQAGRSGESTTPRACIAVECGQRKAGLQVPHLQRLVP